MLKQLNLREEGMRALINLTNQQFEFWHAALREETSEPIPPGSLMHYWFILSGLAQHADSSFAINKKEAFRIIPNLSEEAVRKHVAAAGQLGFVETVKTKRVVKLRLTPAGQRAVERTLSRWVEEFAKLQDQYFRN